MTNFIPIFPLGIVVFPNEDLNLHVFEPRYKQLVKDCFANKKPFGIPAVLNTGLKEMGTLVEIKEIVEVYKDGKMDIRTKGLQVFKMLDVVKTIPSKLYSGAIVNYPQNITLNNAGMMRSVMALITEFHKSIKVKKDFKIPTNELLSYDVAHHVGFTMQEEYELLGLYFEAQRLEYIKRHLQKNVPATASITEIKKRIQMNGHFRELKGYYF